MTGIRHILFDFGNVIIDLDIPRAPAGLLALMRPDLSSQAMENYLTHLVSQYETSVIDTDVFINGILTHARRGVTADEVVDAWNSMLIGIPVYRLAMLEALKLNFNVLMLSNTNPLHLGWIHNNLAENHGILDFETRYFNTVYYSHQIGFRKPQAEAFEFVMKDAYITPSNTLFIDDTEENIRSAKKLGFKTRLSRAEEEIAEVLKEMGYY